MSRAVIYTRLSKDEPGSHSLDDQERDCRDLAERRGLTVAEVYREREGTSAYRQGVKRPKFDQMLDELESGTTVIAWELSRITRRGSEQAGPVLATLEEVGASLLTVVDGIDTARDDSELNWSVRAAIAKDESAKISKRSRRGLAARRRQGYHHGRAPFGLRKVDGRLEIDPENYPVAREIADRALRGESVYSIVKALNEAGGRTWAKSSVNKLLRSPGFAGYATHHERQRTGKYATRPTLAVDEDGAPIPVGEGVVSLDEHRQIQARMDARTQAGIGRNTGKRAPSILLSGIARCSQCGGPMVGTTTDTDGTIKLYGCSRRMATITSCDHAYVSRKHADWEVVDRFLGMLAALDPEDDADLPILVAVAEAWTRRTRPEDAARADMARDQLAAAETALQRLDDDYDDDLIDRESYVRRRTRLADRRDAAARELSERADTQADISPLLDPELMAEAWEAAGLTERRDYLTLAVDHVVVHPAKRRGRFDPERIEVMWKGE